METLSWRGSVLDYEQRVPLLLTVDDSNYRPRCFLPVDRLGCGPATVHHDTIGTVVAVVDGIAGCFAVASDAIDDASGAPDGLFPQGSDPPISRRRNRSRRKGRQALLGVGEMLATPWGIEVAKSQSQDQCSLGV